MTTPVRHIVLDPQTGELLAVVHGAVPAAERTIRAVLEALHAYGFELVEEPGGRALPPDRPLARRAVGAGTQ